MRSSSNNNCDLVRRFSGSLHSCDSNMHSSLAYLHASVSAVDSPTAARSCTMTRNLGYHLCEVVRCKEDQCSVLLVSLISLGL